VAQAARPPLSRRFAFPTGTADTTDAGFRVAQAARPAATEPPLFPGERSEPDCSDTNDAGFRVAQAARPAATEPPLFPGERSEPDCSDTDDAGFLVAQARPLYPTRKGYVYTPGGLPLLNLVSVRYVGNATHKSKFSNFNAEMR